MQSLRKKINNKIKKLKPKKVVFVPLLVLIFSLSVGFYNFVGSSVLDNISGYVWSASDWTDKNNDGIQQANEFMFDDLNDNGIQDPGEPIIPGGMGWLSLNCSTGGNCGEVNYGVNIDATGNLTGYAWSPNYGWMKFGGLSDFPAGAGYPVSENAKVNFSAPGVLKPITGWARFCSPAASPTQCEGFVKNLRNGKWDGWVALSGLALDATAYGLSLDTTSGALSGYAWGGGNGDGVNIDDGENVVGWMHFANAMYQEVVDPTVTIFANPANIPNGYSTVLSWTGINIDPSVPCNASGSWGGTQPYPAPLGGVTIGPLSTGTYTYSIQCFGPGNIPSNVSSVEVTVGGTTVLNFYADPSPSYPPYTTNLFWNAIPSNPGLHGCVASSAPPLNIAEVSDWNPLTPLTPLNPPTPSSSTVSVPYNPTKYRLTCKDEFENNVTSTISVPQGVLPESVSLSSNGVIESPPGTYTTTLFWSTVNADSCVASGGGGNWSGSRTIPPGNQSGVIVPPGLAFTTYTLTCIGNYSGQQISVSIQLNQGSGRTFNIKRPVYKEQ